MPGTDFDLWESEMELLRAREEYYAVRRMVWERIAAGVVLVCVLGFLFWWVLGA